MPHYDSRLIFVISSLPSDAQESVHPRYLKLEVKLKVCTLGLAVKSLFVQENSSGGQTSTRKSVCKRCWMSTADSWDDASCSQISIIYLMNVNMTERNEGQNYEN